MGCGTVIGIAVASEHSGFVTPIVTRRKAAKARASRAAAVIGAPVSLGAKRRATGWRKEMAKRIGCCWAAIKGYELPQWALWEKWASITWVVIVRVDGR